MLLIPHKTRVVTVDKRNCCVAFFLVRCYVLSVRIQRPKGRHMKIIDTAASHRAVTLVPGESLDSRSLVTALISKGHGTLQATELVAQMFDGLEEAGM
jgi:hypothetical protein